MSFFGIEDIPAAMLQDHAVLLVREAGIFKDDGILSNAAFGEDGFELDERHLPSDFEQREIAIRNMKIRTRSFLTQVLETPRVTRSFLLLFFKKEALAFSPSRRSVPPR
jgi:hypothetical protein